MPSLPEQCWDLIRAQTQCVLATQGPEGPHCSLMSYLPGPEIGCLYLVTGRDTRKFANLVAHPRVSLLVDDRAGGAHGRARRALTIAAYCAALDPGPERDRLVERFRAAHPALAPILADPGCAVLRVTVVSFQFLDGVTRARYMEI